MFGFFFGAALALTLCSSKATAARHPAPVATRAKPALPSVRHTPVPTVAELYSLRARRRMATYLRLRLLEWREAGLERAAAVIERRLPVDMLVPKTMPADDSAKH